MVCEVDTQGKDEGVTDMKQKANEEEANGGPREGERERGRIEMKRKRVCFGFCPSLPENPCEESGGRM